MNITGTIVYKELSGGFWGIKGDDGQEWLPVELPKELEKRGLKVKLKAKKAEDYLSIYMWGTPIEIKSYDVIR